MRKKILAVSLVHKFCRFAFIIAYTLVLASCSNTDNSRDELINPIEPYISFDPTLTSEPIPTLTNEATKYPIETQDTISHDISLPLAGFPLSFNDSIPYDENRMAAEIKIEIPQWISRGNDVYAKMNDYYREKYEVLLEYSNGFSDLHKSDKEYNYVVCYSFDYNYDCVLINDRYLQVAIKGFVDGGAHPSHTFEPVVWDLQKSNIITLDDIFDVPREVYMSRIKEIAQNDKWASKYNINDIISNINLFYFGQHSVDGENGIVFYFPEYSVGSYADGLSSLMVKYSDVRNIINSDFDLKNISYRYIKDELLHQSISLAIDALDISEYPIYRFYEGNLDYMPDGFYKNICLVTYVESINNFRLYLFAISVSYDRALLLSYMDIDFLFNDAKMNVFFEEDNIRVWSQMPFSAAEVNALLKWDGNDLKIIEAKYGDPSQDVLSEQRKFLESKDIDGLMAFEDNILYPLRYPDFLELPKPILSFAHEEALKEYKNGNISRALKIMEYGLKLYTDRHILPDPDSTDGYVESDFKKQDVNLFTKDEFMALINDYAFFLYENGDYQRSLKLLLNVESLCPDRVVVYINLGDLHWDMKEREKAVSCYEKYKELLGNDSKLPERVILRLENSPFP